MARSKAGFSTLEAAFAARLSHRQVGYWARTRLVIPSIVDAAGTGNHRRFNLRDITTLRVLAAFRQRGLSLQALRQVQHYLRNREASELQDVHARLVFAPGRVREVLLVKSAEEIVSLLEAPGQVVAPVVVDVSAIFRDVAARVSDLEEMRRAKAAKCSARKVARVVANIHPHERAVEKQTVAR
jgi:DNA-binding transcriptional MerR regulator